MVKFMIIIMLMKNNINVLKINNNVKLIIIIYTSY